MGFFTPFENVWKDGLSWKGFNDGFKAAFSDLGGAGKSFVGGLWNTIQAGYTMDADKAHRGVNDFIDFGKSLLSATGNAAVGTLEAPVVKVPFGEWSQLQNEVVKRPIGTAALVFGGVGRDYLNAYGQGKTYKGPFDPETWRQAYNDTRTVSAGQALGFLGQETSPFSAQQALYAAGGTDPRTKQGQQYWHNDQVGKWESGGLDTWANFIDPLITASKLTKAGKLRYISNVMDAPAIRRGAPEAYIASDAANKFFDFTRNAADAETVRQMAFNKVPKGSLAAQTLHDAAKIDDPTAARQVFDDTLLHLMGDPTALDRIAQVAPRVATAVGDMGDGAKFGSVAKDVGAGDAATDTMAVARSKTDTQGLLDEAANDIYNKSAGILLNQPAPRLTLTSDWRVGVHQYANGTRGTFWADTNAARSVTRKFLPSSTFTRFINLEDPGPTAVENMRANWESAGVLEPDQLNQYVQRYGTALDAHQRFEALMAGENAIFKAIAAKYGFSPEAAEKAVQRINSLRVDTRTYLAQSRMYMSTEARKMAETLWDKNRYDESARLRELADNVDGAVSRGEQPSETLHVKDLDGHGLLVPMTWDMKGTPVMPAQQADVAAAMDWRYLHSALWWETKGPVGQKAYKVYDSSRALLDAASSVWKFANLARPGYTWRMLTDEHTRALAMIGAGPMFSAAVGGLGNAVGNTLTRLGRLKNDAWLEQKAARGLATHDTVTDAEEVASGVAHTDLAEARPTVTERPRTSDEVAKAILRRHDRNSERVPQDVRDTIATHTANGTDPISDLAAWVDANGVPKGLKATARVTKKERTTTQQYSDLGKTLADGAITPQQYSYAAQSAFENRPSAVTHDIRMIIRQHKDMGTDPTADLTEHALSLNGRAQYMNGDWRQGYLDDLSRSKMSLADPFSGTAPTKLPDVTDVIKKVRLTADEAHAGVYDYVRTNHDDLLRPDSLLHAQLLRDGSVELGVARTIADDVIKPTGGKRIKVKDYHFDYRQNGTGGLTIPLSNGQVIRIDHAFGGAEGARLEAQVSSTGEGMSWADRITDNTYVDLIHSTRKYMRDVNPEEPHYEAAWQRAVNDQLGNDPVARMILSGKSDNEIVAWMRQDPAGKAYLGKLGPWQRYYWVQVQTVRKMLELYTPVFGEKTAESEALRRAVLDRSATMDQLKAVVGDVRQMNPVHGAAIEAAVANGMINKAYNKVVDKTFKYLGDIPADRMARFPFATERMRVHSDQLAQSYLASYHKAGYDSIPADVVTRIKEQARVRTAADVKKYLYDATTTHDMARMFRLTVPFGSAMADSYSKWGVIFREKPWVPYNLWKVWTSPDKGGFTTDDKDNHKRYINGVPRWVSHDAMTGKETVLPVDYKPKQEYVSLQLASDLLPSWLSAQVDGVKLTPKVNKETFNTFLALPTAGPIVAVPVNTFALDHPEFAENKFIQRFILPFGAQNSSASMFVPGYMRAAYDTFSQQDADMANQQALAIWQTEMVNYAKGDRAKPPTIPEVKHKAFLLKGMRAMYQFAGLSPTWSTPYQPYLDAYRQLRIQDPMNADTIFFDKFGDEYAALVASVTRNNSGVPSTVEGFKSYKAHQNLINQFPDLAGLIIGKEGAGTFSQSVYNWQKQAPASPGSGKKMREQLPLEDTINGVNVSAGWAKYSKFMDLVRADLLDRGLTSIDQKGAQDLKDAKDKLIQQLMYWDSPTGGQTVSPWFVDYSTRDSSLVTARLKGMSQIINDPGLRQRDDIRGLQDYLANRQQMKDMMDSYGFATLNSKKAAGLRGMWDNYVSQLTDQNSSFASLYDRWLSHDQYLDAQL